jgi:DNA-binding transcriptional LysR family regulator
MQLELRQLRSFLAVAEELNFTRAAERLHIAQPALSAQIRQLEQQLGCELFARTTRKVELTSVGRLLLEDAARIVTDADAAAAKITAAARGQRGVLRIVFVAHGAGETGTEILRRFNAAYPHIETEAVEAPTLEEIQLRIRDRDADVGYVWLPTLYDELAAEVVSTERKLVCMHREHPLAEKRAVAAEDLETEPIVAPWDIYPEELIEYWFTPFRKSGRRADDPHGRSLEECFSFVIRGAAVFCVPESVERYFSRPDLLYRPILGVAPAEVAVGWRRDTANPAVETFVATARGVVQGTHEEPVPIQKLSS